MISPVIFVKLAREIIKFIKDGNKLKATQFIYDYNTKTACALGAVCFNHERMTYSFTENYLGLGYDFYSGFDDCLLNYPPPDETDSEEYIFGWDFANMCRKRGWTINES